MKPQSAAKNAARAVLDTFETVNNQTVKPIFEEGLSELGPFFGAPKLGGRPQELAHEDLKRAREEKKLEEMKKEEAQKSKEHYAAIQKNYHTFEQQENRNQQPIKEELAELTSEVVKLAKAAGIETKVHLERSPKKVGRLDIKRLTSIIRFLRIKADEAKSARELVSQRTNAKRTTGMLAWVSGKQMKVHEQGTLQLQG